MLFTVCIHVEPFSFEIIIRIHAKHGELDSGSDGRSNEVR